MQYHTAPAAPSAMTATATSGTTVALSFLDNSSDETGFVIQRNDNNAGWVQLHTPAAAAGTGTTVTDTDTTAVPGHTYQYRAAAANGFVLSDWSNVASVTTVAPPAAPTSLKASLGRGLQVLLSWQDNATNETGFTIERADNGGAFGQIGTLGALKKTGKVTFTDSTVLPGHTYSYRVAAMLGTELSPYSGTAGAVVPAVPAAPSNVTVSVIRNGASDRVTLHWTRNSTNNTGFVIQRCTTPGFLYELSTFIVGSASATNFTQTTNRHVAYYYRVAAVGSTGWSDWVNATPFPIATP